jgi:hypothetical protein
MPRLILACLLACALSGGVLLEWVTDERMLRRGSTVIQYFCRLELSGVCVTGAHRSK